MLSVFWKHAYFETFFKKNSIAYCLAKAGMQIPAIGRTTPAELVRESGADL